MTLSATKFFIGSGLVAVCALFYARTNSIDTAEHEQFDRSLQLIKRLDSTLNQDVLKVRFHLQEDYDSLGEAMDALKEALGNLDAIPRFVDRASRTTLRARIMGLSQLIQEKSELLESFKTQNAVLKNSLRYFPLAGRESVERLRAESDNRDPEALLNEVMQQVLVYSLSPSAEQEQEIRSTLIELRAWRTRKPNHAEAVFVGALSAHAESILTRLPKVERLTQQLVSLPTGPYAKELLILYEAAFGRAMQAAKVYRGVLYAFCGLLLAMVGYTLYALRAANSHLKGHTRDLSAAVAELEKEATERQRAETELEVAHKELLASSRQAGMAEMATGVLHNVGNVLNSVNVASSCVADSLKKSKAANLSKVVALLREHETDLGAFLTSDPKGKQVPTYLAQLAEHLVAEQAVALEELAQLQKNIEHIKDVVTVQQSCAKGAGKLETLQMTDLVEDTLRMDSGGQAHRGIEIIREFEHVPAFAVEKHKVLQILMNLMRNARQACHEAGRLEKRLTLRVTNGEDRIRIAVSDNGVGISPENLARIFAHGFTTKKNGHGFGLHSAVAAAKEMGGSLSVRSEGIGHGATFTLELPLSPAGRNITPTTEAPQLAA